MISYFNKGKSISLGLPFCIFVRNTIYVLKCEVLESVVWQAVVFMISDGNLHFSAIEGSGTKP